VAAASDTERPLAGTDGESRAARAIHGRVQAMAVLSDRCLRTDRVEKGSSLYLLDERFASSRSVSRLVRQSLTAAMDNLQALNRLLFVTAADGELRYRTHTHAPYGLVRTIIECTTTVLWALLPEDGQERARRSLVLIAREVFNAASFWDAYLAEFHPDRHAAVMETFDALRRAVNDSAQELEPATPMFRLKGDGSWGYATKNRTQTSILTDLRSCPDMPEGLMYAWQFCSGYSHGLEWTSADGFVDGFVDGSGPTPMNQAMLRTGTMEQLRYLCDVAFDLVPRAWEIFDLRRRPWPLH
jgi:hypothetical protein